MVSKFFMRTSNFSSKVMLELKTKTASKPGMCLEEGQERTWLEQGAQAKIKFALIPNIMYSLTN